MFWIKQIEVYSFAIVPSYMLVTSERRSSNSLKQEHSGSGQHRMYVYDNV